jgi:hypothetical protein
MPTLTRPHRTSTAPATAGGDLERLARAVAEEGPTAHEEALVALARRALGAGVDPVLCRILVDRSEPAVVRQRAFGRVALGLAGRRTTAVALAA